MMMKRQTHLLIIDPQNDFCDLPEGYRPELASGARATPSLPVPGAHQDMLRLAQLVREGGNALGEITVTLDSHQRIDIAHPTFWSTADGGPVAPFTTIGAEDMRSDRYVPRLAGSAPRVLAYLDALERGGRYRHMVWPVHCEIGSWGHNVHPALREAYNAWEESTLRSVVKVTKGENPWTEHYSAIRAEVPDPTDPATGTNTALIERLRRAERLYIAGEASSHCVKATTEHLVEALSEEEARRLVLISDGMSTVAGFEAAAREFVAAMQARGVSVKTAAEVLEELRDSAV